MRLKKEENNDTNTNNERTWGPTKEEIDEIESDLEFDSLERCGWFELLRHVQEYTSTALGKQRLSV